MPYMAFVLLSYTHMRYAIKYCNLWFYISIDISLLRINIKNYLLEGKELVYHYVLQLWTNYHQHIMVFLLRQEKNFLTITLAIDGRKISFVGKVKDTINFIILIIIIQFEKWINWSPKMLKMFRMVMNSYDFSTNIFCELRFL